MATTAQKRHHKSPHPTTKRRNRGLPKIDREREALQQQLIQKTSEIKSLRQQNAEQDQNHEVLEQQLMKKTNELESLRQQNAEQG